MRATCSVLTQLLELISLIVTFLICIFLRHAFTFTSTTSPHNPLLRHYQSTFICYRCYVFMSVRMLLCPKQFQCFSVWIFTLHVFQQITFCPSQSIVRPITLAARSKAWTVFARSNTGTMGSNPTQGMRLFCVYVILCIGSGLATGWSPVQGVLSTVLD
jgi:hypothetical protein